MTVRELMEKVGTVALLSVDSGALCVPVSVTDAKMAYGRERFFVEAVNGIGGCWVDSSRLLWGQS